MISFNDLNATLRNLAAPESELLSLAEAKSQCAIPADVTDFDTDLTRWIGVAREFVEARSERAIGVQTFRLSLDRFPGGCLPIELRRVPAVSVTAIRYQTTLGQALSVLATSNYGVATDPWPGVVFPIAQWPTIAQPRPGAVQVDFVAGSNTVPHQAIQAMRFLVAHYWANREAIITGTIASEVPLGVDSLIAGLRFR